MAQLPVYSSREVKVTFLEYAFEGLAPDSFIEFALSSDLTDEEIGADGSVSISISPDQTGSCTVSLQQNSPTNIFLSSVLSKQRVQGKIASGSLSIVDPSGSVIALLTGAHIKTAPTISLGSSATGKTYDWVLFCQELKFTATPEGVADDAGLLAEAIAAAENIDEYLL